MLKCYKLLQVRQKQKQKWARKFKATAFDIGRRGKTKNEHIHFLEIIKKITNYNSNIKSLKQNNSEDNLLPVTFKNDLQKQK